MKAVEILKNHIIDLEGMVNIFDEYAMFRTRDETKKAIVELNEAIKELQALENRSCDGCKYHLSENGSYPLNPCSECSRWYSDSWDQK